MLATAHRATAHPVVARIEKIFAETAEVRWEECSFSGELVPVAVNRMGCPIDTVETITDDADQAHGPCDEIVWVPLTCDETGRTIEFPLTRDDEAGDGAVAYTVGTGQ